MSRKLIRSLVDEYQHLCRLSYSEARNEMASVALENVAKVWDVSRPSDSRMCFQLETPGEISQVSFSLLLS